MTEDLKTKLLDFDVNRVLVGQKVHAANATTTVPTDARAHVCAEDGLVGDAGQLEVRFAESASGTATVSGPGLDRAVTLRAGESVTLQAEAVDPAPPELVHDPVRQKWVVKKGDGGAGVGAPAASNVFGPESTPEPEPKPKRRMATKKTAPTPAAGPGTAKTKAPAAAAPAASRPSGPTATIPWSRIQRNVKTDDEQLDFELTFDAEGDPHVSVCDHESVELSVDLGTLKDTIAILAEMYAHALRIASGKVTAADLGPEKATRKVDEDA